MGFFSTMIEGYKIWGSELGLAWQKHGSHILTGGGTGLMLIASALMAKRGSSAEVQQAIAEAEAVIAEVKADQEKSMVVVPSTEISGKGENKIISVKPVVAEVPVKPAKRKFNIAKAKAKKYVKVAKLFWKEAAVEVVGAGMVIGGSIMDANQKTKLATGLAVTTAEFMAYRANVIADQGEAKDLEYLTTKHVKETKKVVSEDGSVIETADPNGGDITVNADPNAFKFWFSPETCPSLYSDNLDLTKMNLEWVENNLTRVLRTNGHLYLNDMRREFGGLTPTEMDVPLGGVYGMAVDRSDKESLKKHVDLGWRADADFCDGRKVGVWIIFPCDPEPIIAKVNNKLATVEKTIY